MSDVSEWVGGWVRERERGRVSLLTSWTRHDYTDTLCLSCSDLTSSVPSAVCWSDSGSCRDDIVRDSCSRQWRLCFN